jgi:hypothetical protein
MKLFENLQLWDLVWNKEKEPCFIVHLFAGVTQSSEEIAVWNQRSQSCQWVRWNDLQAIPVEFARNYIYVDFVFDDGSGEHDATAFSEKEDMEVINSLLASGSETHIGYWLGDFLFDEHWRFEGDVSESDFKPVYIHQVQQMGRLFDNSELDFKDLRDSHIEEIIEKIIDWIQQNRDEL